MSVVGITPVSSAGRAAGRISAAAKATTVSRIMRCTSVRSKLIIISGLLSSGVRVYFRQSGRVSIIARRIARPAFAGHFADAAELQVIHIMYRITFDSAADEFTFASAAIFGLVGDDAGGRGHRLAQLPDQGAGLGSEGLLTFFRRGHIIVRNFGRWIARIEFFPSGFARFDGDSRARDSARRGGLIFEYTPFWRAPRGFWVGTKTKFVKERKKESAKIDRTPRPIQAWHDVKLNTNLIDGSTSLTCRRPIKCI